MDVEDAAFIFADFCANEQMVQRASLPPVGRFINPIGDGATSISTFNGEISSNAVGGSSYAVSIHYRNGFMSQDCDGNLVQMP